LISVDPHLFSLSILNGVLVVVFLGAAYMFAESLQATRSISTLKKSLFLGSLGLLGLEFAALRPISVPLEHTGFVALGLILGRWFTKREPSKPRAPRDE